MFNILYKSLTLILIIALAYMLKVLGLFSKERDFAGLSNIILYITLPSAILINLNGLRFPLILLVISLLGFFCNWMYLWISKRAGRDKEEQSFLMLTINGYNIGNFALPFIAFFLKGLPILVVSLFDAGSSIMVLGGNYAIANNTKQGNSKFNFLGLIETVLRAPTVIVYAVMIVLSLLAIDLPTVVTDIVQIPANANTFLSMFFIGIALEINFETENIKKLFKYITYRYFPALILSVLILLIAFIPMEIKYTLILLLFAPISGTSPIFVGLLGQDVGLSAQVNSLSIILSIFIMSAFLIYLGV